MRKKKKHPFTLVVLSCDWKEGMPGRIVQKAIKDVGRKAEIVNVDDFTANDSKVMFVTNHPDHEEIQELINEYPDTMVSGKFAFDGIEQLKEKVEKLFEKEHNEQD